jgi:ABC-2 type transport system ATP-binding protein
MRIVETRDLSKEYGSRRALDELSLSVEEGDVFGFLGPNGAGKTTTIRILSGLLAPTSGTVSVAGIDVTRHPQAIKRIVGVLPESQGYYGWMTGEEYLEYFGSLYGYSSPHTRARVLLNTVGLGQRARTPVGNYSRGMRQRLGIARALVHSPKILFLDEPSLGLDPKGQRQINSLIKRLNREEGITVFLSSHLLSEIEGLCTRFAIVREGRLVAEGDRRELGARLVESRRLRLEVSKPERALELARTLRDVRQAHLEGETVVVDAEKEAAMAVLIRILVSDGIEVYSARRTVPTLEEIFFGLTEKQHVDVSG